jgi:hypothetical protein
MVATPSLVGWCTPLHELCACEGAACDCLLLLLGPPKVLTLYEVSGTVCRDGCWRCTVCKQRASMRVAASWASLHGHHMSWIAGGGRSAAPQSAVMHSKPQSSSKLLCSQAAHMCCTAACVAVEG